MDNLAAAQDDLLARIAQAGVAKRCEPKLAEAIEPEEWLKRPGAPKPVLADEEGQGKTMDYEDLLRTWSAGQPA
jgi:glycerol transport system substrate-binding protein